MNINLFYAGESSVDPDMEVSDRFLKYMLDF